MQPPTLRDDLPLYPPLLQLLRVTQATVPGPTGYASASVLAPLLYIASTQQLRTDTLLPRDREPCLADDVNGLGLSPGYYLGRLAGSYQSLPVYEVVGAALAGPVSLPGLTPVQVAVLVANLTPAQLANLNNLSACQLQTIVQLNISQIQTLTSTLNPTQISNLVDNTTFTQLSTLVTTTSISQLTVITSAYPQLYQLIHQSLTTSQADSILRTLTSQQLTTLVDLTPSQLRTIGGTPSGGSGLSTTQLQTLTNLTTTQVPTIVGQLTTSQLSSLINTLTTNQLQQLTNTLTPNQIQMLVQGLTTSQIATVTSGLTPSQLTALTAYPPSGMSVMVSNLPTSTLASLLTILGGAVPPPTNPILGVQGFFPNIPIITTQPSSTPSPLLSSIGYAPVVLDVTDNQLWSYLGGAWRNLTGSSGGGGTTSPLTTKGDVWGYSTTNARIPVGFDSQVLTADSAQALGVKWATPSGASITSDHSTSGSYSATSTLANSGPSVSLAAGTYLLTAQATAELQGPSSSGVYMSIQIWNSSDSALVGQEARGATANSLDLFINQQTLTICTLLTIASGTKTITLQAKHNDTMGNPTTRTIDFQELAWVKIA